MIYVSGADAEGLYAVTGTQTYRLCGLEYVSLDDQGNLFVASQTHSFSDDTPMEKDTNASESFSHTTLSQRTYWHHIVWDSRIEQLLDCLTQNQNVLGSSPGHAERLMWKWAPRAVSNSYHSNKRQPWEDNRMPKFNNK